MMAKVLLAVTAWLLSWFAAGYVLTSYAYNRYLRSHP